MEDTTAEDDKEEEMKEGDDGKGEDSQDGDEVRSLAESSSNSPGKVDWLCTKKSTELYK